MASKNSPKRGIALGDVFSVNVEKDRCKYFQFICTDTSQLNSDVIRAFKTKFPATESPSPNFIVNEPVDFFAHTMIKLGLSLGKWEKVGNASIEGPLDVMFRDTNDVSTAQGEARIAVSNQWYVWHPNEPFRRIGLLASEYKHAHIGVVLNPNRIVERMRSGAFDFVYPS